MNIRVVGKASPRSDETQKNVIEACAQINLQADISQVTEAAELPNLGAWLTPAVLVDGKVVSAGKVPTAAELKRILTD